MNGRYIDVMVDIETTGINPGCGIWQIGIATSIPDISAFSCTINPYKLELQGFRVDKQTTQFQQEKNTANWNAALELQEDVGIVRMMMYMQSHIDRIKQYAEAEEYSIRYWAFGTSFDFPIIESVLIKCGVKNPFPYRAIYDLRTLCNLFNRPLPNYARKHEAIEDAVNQLKHLETILEECFDGGN